jgi:hypothetical protein
MRHLSIRLPEHLYQQLETKAHEMGDLKISDTIRILLCASLSESTVRYDFKTYTLVYEAIMSLVDDPQSLIDRASQRDQ